MSNSFSIPGELNVFKVTKNALSERMQPSDSNKKVITFTMSRNLQNKLHEALIKSTKYNLKKKSEWVYEAIEMLIENPDYKDFVFNSQGAGNDYVHDRVRLNFDQRCIFSDIRNEVVREYPHIRGPQGSLLRAAILSRLTRDHS